MKRLSIDSSFPIVASGGKIFFAASNGDEEIYLWVSNGKTEGTKPLISIRGLWDYLKIEIVPFKDKVFFFRLTGDYSLYVQLWISDGTPDGTMPLFSFDWTEYLDIGEPIVFKDKLFFRGFSKKKGWELWVSDGTPEGTDLFLDLKEGNESSYPNSFTIVNSNLFFVLNRGLSDEVELWITDGSKQNTKRLIEPNYLKDPFYLTPTKNYLYFSGNLNGEKYGLWRSDGTKEGTIFLAELYVNSINNEVIDLAELPSGKVLFSASTDFLGTEIWETNGTPENTHLFKDIIEGPSSSEVSWLTSLKNFVFFSAKKSYSGKVLWKTDGTEEGTKEIYSTSGPFNPYNLKTDGNNLWFFALSPSFGLEPWISDGTEEGTKILANISLDNGSSELISLTPVKDGKIIFFFKDLFYGNFKLLSSDGSFEGTKILIDLEEINNYHRLGPFTSNKDFAIFPLYTEDYGFELWKSDGTNEGTGIIKDIIQGSTSSVDNEKGIFLNGFYYFSGSNGINGLELWKTDGTAEKTRMVVDICTTPEDPLNPTQSSWPLKFTSNSNRLFWVARGTNKNSHWYSLSKDKGTIDFLVDFGTPSQYTYFGPTGSTEEKAFLFIYNPQHYCWNLWVSNGTQAIDCYDIWSNYNIPENLFSFENKVFFSADFFYGNELWVSDGTTEGTYELKDIYLGGKSSYPSNFVELGQKFYFRANDGINGYELWESDGTEEGTKLFMDICPGLCSSFPNFIVSKGEKIYFSGTDGIHGEELWESDGTPEGTRMVFDIKIGCASSTPKDLTISGTKLYFTAEDGINGRELWCYEIP